MLLELDVRGNIEHQRVVLARVVILPGLLVAVDQPRDDGYRVPRGDLAGAARAAPRGGSATRAEIRDLFLLEPQGRRSRSL